MLTVAYVPGASRQDFGTFGVQCSCGARYFVREGLLRHAARPYTVFAETLPLRDLHLVDPVDPRLSIRLLGVERRSLFAEDAYRFTCACAATVTVPESQLDALWDIGRQHAFATPCPGCGTRGLYRPHTFCAACDEIAARFGPIARCEPLPPYLVNLV